MREPVAHVQLRPMESADVPAVLDVQVTGEYNDLPPTADDTFLVYTATRP